MVSPVNLSCDSLVSIFDHLITTLPLQNTLHAWYNLGLVSKGWQEVVVRHRVAWGHRHPDQLSQLFRTCFSLLEDNNPTPSPAEEFIRNFSSCIKIVQAREIKLSLAITILKICTCLENLSFYWLTQGHPNLQVCFTHLEKLPHLKKLELSFPFNKVRRSGRNITFYPHSTDIFKHLGRCTGLTDLKCNVWTLKINELAELKSLTKLQTLDLRYHLYQGQEPLTLPLVALFTALPLLNTFSLACTHEETLDTIDETIFEAWDKQKKLETLKLGSSLLSKIDGNRFERISQKMKLSCSKENNKTYTLFEAHRDTTYPYPELSIFKKPSESTS